MAETPSKRSLALAREIPCWGKRPDGSLCCGTNPATGNYFCPACCYQLDVARLIDRAVAERTEQCAIEIEGKARHYPTDIFLPPRPGQHADTVAGCSASALRNLAPIWADAIRALGPLGETP